jgi:hypothetical protein
VQEQGKSLLDCWSLGFNSQTDGVLLVNHGKDEGTSRSRKPTRMARGRFTSMMPPPRAREQLRAGPGGFCLYSADGHLGGFRPLQRDGSIIIYSGAEPQFTVEQVKVGQWLLKMKNYARPTAC